MNRQDIDDVVVQLLKRCTTTGKAEAAMAGYSHCGHTALSHFRPCLVHVHDLYQTKRYAGAPGGAKHFNRRALGQNHITDAGVKAVLVFGLRPGSVELFSLTWDRVSWEKRTSQVTAAAKGSQDRRRATPRLVPIDKDFYDELWDWYKKDRRVKGPLIHYHDRAVKSMKTA